MMRDIQLLQMYTGKNPDLGTNSLTMLGGHPGAKLHFGQLPIVLH